MGVDRTLPASLYSQVRRELLTKEENEMPCELHAHMMSGDLLVCCYDKEKDEIYEALTNAVCKPRSKERD